MNRSTEMQKQVLVDGIDELEATPALQKQVKHLRAGAVDYQRAYKHDLFGNGVVDVDKYENGIRDEAYQREFTFVRNPNEKSDVFNIDRLVEVNVKEPSRNIDQNINIAELNEEQVDILNGVLMTEEQTDREVLLSQYKGLSDGNAMQKLVKETERVVPNDNGKDNAGAVNFQGANEPNRNMSMNLESPKEDHKEAVESTHEEEDMEHINSTVRKNTRITQQSEEEHEDNQEARKKALAEAKLANQAQSKGREYLIKSYGIKERSLYVNDRLNLNIEGTQKSMSGIEKIVNNVTNQSLPYDEYNKQINNIINGDKSFINAEKLEDNDLSALSKYRIMEKVPTNDFYEQHVNGAFNKLMKDYQNQDPNRALLVDLDTARNALDDRFNAKHKVKARNRIDNMFLENKIIKAAQENGNFINERGDKYVTNLKNAGIDKIISLSKDKALDRRMPTQSLDIGKDMNLMSDNGKEMKK